MKSKELKGEEEPILFKYNMDFRPVGDQGNKVGAAARQRARMEQIERVGRGVLANEAFTGKLVMITPANGGILYELVKAGTPIPEIEMVPNSEVELSGVFTPFEHIGNSFFVKNDRPKV